MSCDLSVQYYMNCSVTLIYLLNIAAPCASGDVKKLCVALCVLYFLLKLLKTSYCSVQSLISNRIYNISYSLIPVTLATNFFFSCRLVPHLPTLRGD